MNGNLFQGAIERTLKPLRPRQESAIEQIRQAIREGHKRIIVQAPTGFGKTVLASHVIAGCLDKGKRPMFCAPAINLINQTVASLESQGILDIGVIQAAHPRTNIYARTQVGSIQTLIQRGIPEANVMLLDEAHNSWKKFNAMIDEDSWKNTVIIGLTATPWARGMGLRWTRLIVAATTKELIAEGWLTPTIGYGPEKRYEPNVAGLKSKRNEFGESEFDQEQGAKIMLADEIVGNTVEMWRKYGTPDKTFLFAMNRKHAEVLQQAFIEQGVPWGFIDGFSTPEERKELFRQYDAGEIRGISSVGCLTTGIDKDVRTIIDCQITKSKITHVQKGGRGIRTAPGKEHLVYIDQAGNNSRLGFFFDIHYDHLDTHMPGEKGTTYSDEDKQVKPPKKCPTCYRLMPAGTKVCACGYKDIASTEIEHTAGDLVLWGQDVKPKKKEPKKPATPAEKRQFLAELKGYAEIHQKPEKWLLAKFHSKFNEWPRAQQGISAEMPTQSTMSWIKSSNIKYFKGKEKSAKASASAPWGGLAQ